MASDTTVRVSVPSDYPNISAAVAAEKHASRLIVKVSAGKHNIRKDPLGHGDRGNDLGMGLLLDDPRQFVHICQGPETGSVDLHGSIFVGPNAKGVVIQGVSIINERSHNLYGFGVFVKGPNCELRNCTIKDAATIGISVYGSCKMFDCQVVGSNRSGIVTHGRNSTLTMERCRVEKNRESGVVIGGGMAQASDIQCKGNSDRGVWVCGGAKLQLDFSDKDVDRDCHIPCICGNAQEGLVAEGEGTTVHVMMQSRDLGSLCKNNGDCSEDNVYEFDGGKINCTNVGEDPEIFRSKNREASATQ